jgi:hypothetical protein
MKNVACRTRLQQQDFFLRCVIIDDDDGDDDALVHQRERKLQFNPLVASCRQ